VNVANVHYQGSLDVEWQYDSAFVETRHNGPPKKHSQQLFVVDTGTLHCLPLLCSPPQESHYAVFIALEITKLQQNLQNCA
jgi:hypothetical protein